MTPLLRMAVALAMVCLGARAYALDVKRDVAIPPNATEAAVEVGIGVICNSSDQIKRYLSLKKGEASIQNAIQLVNLEAKDERACGMAMVAFVTGHEADNVDVTDGTMHVRQITIVAVATDAGWHQIPETVQYTAFFEKLVSA